jgi:transposase
MAVETRRNLAEARRQKVAEYYFRLKMRQEEIATQLGVSQATIARDVKILLTRWRETTLADLTELRARELADLESMERDCAILFAQSKDPRFMSERRQLKKRRADMLGLDAPVRLTGPNAGPIQIQPVSGVVEVTERRALPVASADDLLGEVVLLQQRTLGALARAEEQGDARAALQAVREVRQNVELLAKLLAAAIASERDRQAAVGGWRGPSGPITLEAIDQEIARLEAEIGRRDEA